MLDLGFIHDLKKIVKMVPKRRQTMLFSATMPQTIADLSADYLSDPIKVSVTPPGKAADKVEQRVHFVLGRDHKTTLLKDELRANGESALSLVFCKTKHGAEKLMKHLEHSGFNAASIHGNKSHGQRDRALKGFRDGGVRILVATDVAARGIDVPGISHVYNYDLPNVPDTYVHRIGRAARAGREGIAIAFCGPEDLKLLYDIEKLMGMPVPVASGERPDWQGKKKAGGGEGHRGRRPESRGPREEREKQEQYAARRPRPEREERQPRPNSGFSEVEELSGGEFRPVRAEHQGDRPEHRNDGRRRERPGHRGDAGKRPERAPHAAHAGNGDRPSRGERPARAEQRDGRNRPEAPAKPAAANRPNRHSPVRNAGYADEKNLIGADAPEAARPRKPQNRSGRPQGEGGSKRWQGGGRQNSQQRGDRRS
jgi:ATP-dependent RNA helicase RhlE